jgi:heme/copper-type cytochrome/quinol oxidase subunit 2
MNIMVGLVFVIIIVALVATLLVTRKPDENYRGSTKRNTTNLTLIYAVVIFIALIALGIYIWQVY